MVDHQQKTSDKTCRPVRDKEEVRENREKRKRIRPKKAKISSFEISRFNQHEPNNKRTRLSVKLKGSTDAIFYADDLTTDALKLFQQSTIRSLPSWNRITPRLRIMYYHEALVKLKPCIAFSLNLTEDVIKAAHKSGNVTTYLREQIRRQMKYRFPKNIFHNNISFVFAVEAHHYPKDSDKPRIEQIAPHLHGVISIPTSDNWVNELKDALKAAGGGGLPRQIHLSMIDTLSDGTYINWCGGYATKLLKLNKDIITGKSIVSTQDLNKVGKALYNHDRQQFSEYMKNSRSTCPSSPNVSKIKIETRFPAPLTKEEVLEETQTSDPDASTQPTLSSEPYTPEKAIIEKLAEPVQIPPVSKKRYTLEEAMEIISELDDC